MSILGLSSFTRLMDAFSRIHKKSASKVKCNQLKNVTSINFSKNKNKKTDENSKEIVKNSRLDFTTTTRVTLRNAPGDHWLRTFSQTFHRPFHFAVKCTCVYARVRVRTNIQITIPGPLSPHKRREKSHSFTSFTVYSCTRLLCLSAYFFLISSAGSSQNLIPDNYDFIGIINRINLPSVFLASRFIFTYNPPPHPSNEMCYYLQTKIINGINLKSIYDLQDIM